MARTSTVRWAVMVGVAYFGFQAAAVALGADQSFKVRVATANVLVEDPGPVALFKLRRLSTDPHPLVRLAAVHALSRRSESLARRTVAFARYDADARVSQRARHLLARR